jgi:hypothetical protein
LRRCRDRARPLRNLERKFDPDNVFRLDVNTDSIA